MVRNSTKARNKSSVSIRFARKLGTSVALGLCGLGMGGCSAEKNATSQFHAVDGNLASLIYYVGFQVPSDDPRVVESARGKVVACWYRSNVLVRRLDPAVQGGFLTAEQAHQSFFARGNSHTRLTRFPSRCEDVPEQAARSLGVTTDYTPMCSPGFDKSDALSRQSAQALQLTTNTKPTFGDLLGQVALTLGKSKVDTIASKNPNNRLATAAQALVTVVSHQFNSNAAGGSGTPLGASIAMAVEEQAETNPGNPIFEIAGALAPLWKDGGKPTTDAVFDAATTAANTLGDGVIKINDRIRFRPADMIAVLKAALNKKDPATPPADAAASPEAASAPSPAAASPNTAAASPETAAASPETAAPTTDFERAHPKVEMDQLNRISIDVRMKVGKSPQMVLGGTELTFPECPLSFQ